MPLLLLLVLLNVGYSIGAIPLLDQSNVANWIATSWYMSVTVVFFALVVAEDTAARLDMLRRGLIVGAMIASLAAIAGYLNLVPGGYDLLTLYGRARGTFKDPNVLGAFLILPALLVLAKHRHRAAREGATQHRRVRNHGAGDPAGILPRGLGRPRHHRGLHAAADGADQPHRAERSRIVVMTGVAALVAVALVAVLLSFDSVAEMFKQRASFDQSYDEGRFGRFGRHILGADMALDLPFGIGPLQFHHYFPEDTHNSYLNAFMSGGWLSGICYPTLVFLTVILGFRHIFTPVPWQRTYLAIFAAFLGTVGESFIIDTDHWRHFFMMLGAMWGLFAAAQRDTSKPRRAPTAPAGIDSP